MVIEHTPEIKCVRNRMINERSVYMAVKDREVERAKVLRSNISQNFKEQDEEAKKQFKLKNEEQKKAIEKQISVNSLSFNYFRKMKINMLKINKWKNLKREDWRRDRNIIQFCFNIFDFEI